MIFSSKISRSIICGSEISDDECLMGKVRIRTWSITTKNKNKHFSGGWSSSSTKIWLALNAFSKLILNYLSTLYIRFYINL